MSIKARLKQVRNKLSAKLMNVESETSFKFLKNELASFRGGTVSGQGF